jgi:hypothetical protein
MVYYSRYATRKKHGVLGVLLLQLANPSHKPISFFQDLQT